MSLAPTKPPSYLTKPTPLQLPQTHHKLSSEIVAHTGQLTFDIPITMKQKHQGKVLIKKVLKNDRKSHKEQ